MKIRFKKFSEFAERLFPHETQYLLNIQQFNDPENLAILEKVNELAEHAGSKIVWPDFDKRKYSRLADWIEEKLDQTNVDHDFEQLLKLENLLMTDSIDAEHEKQLLRILKQTASTDYFFVKRYELAQHFRHYLQIRLRHSEYALVSEFLLKFRTAYEHSRHSYERLQDATVDITHQYSFNDSESKQWESWLLSVFRDPSLDGMNRYYALVRLIFLYYNYGLYQQMDPLYEEMDQLLSKGYFYSRRILTNYYGNRLLAHSKTGQLEQAERYGYLSIKEKNSDYLHYVNNLGAVLLRSHKLSQALQLMQSAAQEMKRSPSFHHKTSYVALYIRCLIESKQYKEAESYGEAFLQAYRNELMQNRWHLFFTNLLLALFFQRKYQKVLQLIKKYDLIVKENKYLQKIHSLATIRWYQQLALYKSAEIERNQLKVFLDDFLHQYRQQAWASRSLEEFKSEVKKFVPEVI